jgi:FkbM family methyltransferase
MQRNEIRNAYIKSAKISEGSRFSRIFRHPFKTLLPPSMRKLGIQRRLNIRTVWGGNFTGVLPEAVTSEIWRSGSFELPVGLSILKFLPDGGTMADVGAHFGYFSLFASHLVGPKGKVISVEPMPSTFHSLKRNVENNSAHTNITLFQGAAFSERKELEFRDFGLVASSLNSAFNARDTQHIVKGEGEAVTVQAHTVDDIFSAQSVGAVDVIKIDAESSEIHVLRGMTETLARMRPVIIMEVGDAAPDGTATEQLLSFLRDLKYQAYNWTETCELARFVKTGHVSYANLTFVPDERII